MLWFVHAVSAVCAEWHPSCSLDTLSSEPALQMPAIKVNPVKLDKGLFGGKAGKGRIYCDITLPALTSNLLVDVGMNMLRMPGILGEVPRWFSMFSPTACPTGELYTAPKSESAILLTMRTYF